LFFQALNQPIKIHVPSGLGDAARINFEHKQHSTRDLLRRLQQQGRLAGHAAGSGTPPAGWAQFGNLAGIARWPEGLRRAPHQPTRTGENFIFIVYSQT
jgi:hypothetical protein